MPCGRKRELRSPALEFRPRSRVRAEWWTRKERASEDGTVEKFFDSALKGTIKN